MVNCRSIWSTWEGNTTISQVAEKGVHAHRQTRERKEGNHILPPLPVDPMMPFSVTLPRLLDSTIYQCSDLRQQNRYVCYKLTISHSQLMVDSPPIRLLIPSSTQKFCFKIYPTSICQIFQIIEQVCVFFRVLWEVFPCDFFWDYVSTLESRRRWQMAF